MIIMKPKIFLTGDVHSESSHFDDQGFSNLNEVESAQKYIDITEKNDLKATLFFTGKAVEQDAAKIKEMADKKNVEIGAHTYNSLRPKLMHRAFRKFLNSYYGPSLYQKLDIKRTKRRMERSIGLKPESWRTHAYRSDINTPEILENEGFRFISDERLNDNLDITRSQKIISAPINVIPDHEHLIHAKKTIKSTDNNNSGDVFSNKHYEIDEYISIVKQQIENRLNSGSHAILLIHPMCMEAADKMRKFEHLCEYISKKDWNTELLRNIE